MSLYKADLYGNDLQWTRRFFDRLKDTSLPEFIKISGYSAHYYSGTAGDALHFDENQWYELLHKAGFMEELLEPSLTLKR